MNNKNYINIYNNLVKFSRNKSIFSYIYKKDTFSDRLLIFYFILLFFLKNTKKHEDKETCKNFLIIFLKNLKLVYEK